MIRLQTAAIEFTEAGCTTRFIDGSHLDSVPHETPHYFIIAARCGYGDDILAYTQEHDAMHLLIAERVLLRPSILWLVAHNRRPFSGDAQMEEALTQAVQRYVRANEEPIIADFPWHELKATALRLLDG